jgi:hypothetical protein
MAAATAAAAMIVAANTKITATIMIIIAMITTIPITMASGRSAAAIRPHTIHLWSKFP